jgi:hypothetical protein
MILERNRRGMVENEKLLNTKQEFLPPELRSRSMVQNVSLFMILLPYGL